jgi:alpha-beta hydrolase superfamily lysophospholipase
MSQPSPDSTLSTFTASDGENIAVQDWPWPLRGAPRGMVLIVHGLGEHAGRYDALAKRLNQWGFAVRSYDQYGHGESDGVRGGLPTANRLLDDLTDLVESCYRRAGPGVPLLLFGHSMGGLLAASFVSRGRQPVDALVLSSPLLAMRLNPVQKMMMRVMPKVAPNLTVNNGVDPEFLSHDRAVVDDYRIDPRVHNRVSGRLARFLADEAPAVVARAAHWQVPTLLLYAGQDKVVDPEGSRAFAAAAPRTMVASHCFEDHYHEIFNEADREPVYGQLQQWLDARF